VAPRVKLALAEKVGAIALGAALLGSPAVRAQVTAAAAAGDGSATSQSTGLEEIVVTARRREERAQSVPLEMNTFAPQQLETEQVNYLTDLMQDTPGLTRATTSESPAFVFLRGVPGVLSYWNDAPIDVGTGALYFDLDNLEVLKGPQGTLFGIATDGGAILLNTKMPSTNSEGYLKSEFGSYDHRLIEGAVNIPLASDKFLIRIGGKTDYTDGYQTIVNQDNLKKGKLDFWIGRISTIFRPTDNFQNYLAVNYYNDDSNGQPSTGLINIQPNGLAATIFGYQNLLANAWPGALGTYRANNYYESDPFIRQLNVNDTATWNLNDKITFKNIFAYQRLREGALTNVDGSPLPIFSSQALNTAYGNGATGGTKQLSEEFQVLGKALDDKLSYTVGTFNQWLSYPGPHTLVCSDIFGGATGCANNSGHNSTNAVYGQATYNLSDYLKGVSFTGGYRYTWDKIDTTVVNGTPAGALTSTRNYVGAFSAPSYTLSLDWQATAQTMLYITNSKGYSKGGFNTGIGLPTAYVDYQPESLNNVEVGMKADWSLPGDMKARTNIDVYYGFYENVQVPVDALIIQNGKPIGESVLYENAAQAHVEGVEAELTLIPIDPLSITLDGAWNQDKYDHYVSGGVDLSNTLFVFDPKWQYTFKVRYRLPVPATFGGVSIGGNFTYTAKMANATDPTNPFDYNGAMHNLDLNLTWDDVMGHKGIQAIAYGTNVTNNTFGIGGLSFEPAFGFLTRNIAPPAMWGISLKYSFD
jgi:iron complex outermembrane receptor protein